MPLLPGTNLGPYEVIARVGAGGMGEVYKARDTRVDRIVAIKISQERFSERFEREARAIAALNHPHICQLYDVGPDYLVMEYVEGKPVTGPLPLAEVMRLTSQIADALDAAHSKGMVHRDLKPDNILVTRSGIKLLDFGLAKTVAATKAAAAPDETVTRALTQEGAIVGTLQYMSPEQLQGSEVDSRSDIFSFGAVLYEMLTGRRAFDGANRASIIAAILTSEPPPLPSHDPISPPAVDRVLRRCLAKNPDARWQSVRDVSTAMDCIPDLTPAVATAPARGLLSKVLWISTAVVLAAMAGLSAYLLRVVRETPRVVRFTIPAQSVQYGSPFVSPDGSRIAYVTGDTQSSQLWVRPLSSFEAQKIEGAEEPSDPIWSPDSKEVAIATHGKLYRFDVTGKTRKVVCDIARTEMFSGGSWNSSGSILFAYGDAGILRVPASGGEPITVTRVDHSRGELYHLFPKFLPDDRHFLFLAVNQRSADSVVYEGSIDSPQVQRVMTSPIGPFFVIGNDLIFVRGSTLMAQKFDAKTARVLGDPVSLQEHVFANSSSYSPVAGFKISPGVLAYFPEGRPNSELVWLDRQGRRISSVGTAAQYTNPALSPDQKQVAAGVFDPRTNQRDVWLIDSSGGATRLTDNPKDDFNPVWSPDGARIAFVSDRNGVRDLYVKPSNRIGDEKLLLASADQKAIEAWSPDGKYILYNNQNYIQAIPVEGERKPFRVVEGPGLCDQAAISPDGKWIAYRSHDSGHVDVYIQAFRGSTTHWQISTNGGGEPSWRRDGKELYFVRDQQLFAVEIKESQGGIEHATPKLLFTTLLTQEIRRNRYVPSPDGQRFLVVAQSGKGGHDAHIVLNWRSALKGN